MWLFAIFLAIPLIEIALFIKIGGWLTLWPTLAIVVATAVIGTSIVRRQGLHALAQLNRSMAEMSDPTAPLAHGAMILLAGALLVTPGFFTDALGFLLLVPAVRRFVIRRAATRVRAAAAEDPRRGHMPRGETVIDAEFYEIDPAQRPTHPPSGWTRH